MDSREASARVRRGASRFFSGFYIANALIIASYAFVRLWFLRESDLQRSKFQHAIQLLPKEEQAFTLLGIVIMIKFFRRQSNDAFLSDAFFFCKSAIGLLSYYMDTRLFIYYLLMYTMIALLFPQPLYQGPSKIEYFTPASFSELVEDRKDDETSWLIEFFAPWAPQCLFLEPVLAELSLTYSSPTLKFGKIDVSRWPSMASTYNISITGVSSQLPTLIMFEKGKESGRIPHVSRDGQVASGKFRRSDIVSAFELEERSAGRKPVLKGKKSENIGSSEKKKKK